MGADLNSLEGVIRHTKRAVLFFHPLDDPAPIKRVWCLYEILTVVTTTGGELRLGFTSSGKAEMFRIAKAFCKVGNMAGKDLAPSRLDSSPRRARRALALSRISLNVVDAAVCHSALCRSRGLASIAGQTGDATGHARAACADALFRHAC